MPHARTARSLVLGLAAAAGTAHAAQPDGVCPSARSPEALERCGQALYSGGRFADAARAFEALAGRTGDVRHLYSAGVAREAAGSDAWASIHLQAFLDRVAGASREHRDAEDRLTRVRGRLVRVALQVSPERALGEAAVLHARWLDGPAGLEELAVPLAALATESGLSVALDRGRWDLWVEPRSPLPAFDRPSPPRRVVVGQDAGVELGLAVETAELVVTVGPPAEVRGGVRLKLTDPYGISPPAELRVRERVALTLRRGPWLYEAQPRRGSAPTRRDEVVVASGAELELRWTPTPQERSRRRRQRQVMLGLGGVGAGVAVIGAALAGVGARGEGAAASPMHAWGSGLLGAGLGLGAGGALEGFAPGQVRLILEAASGGAVGAVGLIWHVSAAQSDEAQGQRAAKGASAALAGLGLGLVASAVTGHLVRRDEWRRGVRLAFGAGATGGLLVVAGRM